MVDSYRLMTSNPCSSKKRTLGMILLVVAPILMGFAAYHIAKTWKMDELVRNARTEGIGYAIEKRSGYAPPEWEILVLKLKGPWPCSETKEIPYTQISDVIVWPEDFTVEGFIAQEIEKNQPYFEFEAIKLGVLVGFVAGATSFTGSALGLKRKTEKQNE